MGKLVTIVGNSGVGKTTLASALCRMGSFSSGLEQHAERPFQSLFSQDLERYALANQIDYLLLRAEQELAIRKGSEAGIQDGGLEQDFYIYTRHFFHKGYLSSADFELCQRLYILLRAALPHPDLIIYLQAPLPMIASRYEKRGRQLEIARLADLGEMQALLDEWLAQVQGIPVIKVDAGADDPGFSRQMEWLLDEINHRLNVG